MYDVIIIGAGPAGISASLYTTRGNLKTLVIYNGISSLEKAKKIDNYYGFKDGISGEELYKIGIEQTQKLETEVKNEEVLKIEMIENGFSVKTINGDYNSKSVILATGSKKNKPKIKGIEKFEGKGVSYCAICDGFFYRNKNVCVLGSGNYAISETNDLVNIAKDIKILTNGEEAPEFRAENVSINTSKIKQINGGDKVEEIEFENGDRLAADGVFVAEGTAGSLEFAKKLGIITKDNKIVVNEKMETNIKGIYACGDITGGILQVSTAVADGTIAGMQVISYIKNS